MKNDLEYGNILIFTIIIFFIGIATANVYHKDKAIIKLNELQKKHANTEYWLDQCQQTTLKLRKEK